MHGSPDISFRIADILVTLSSPLSVSELGIHNRFRAFYATDRDDDCLTSVLLQWKECENLTLPCGEMVYDFHSFWRMYRTGSDSIAVFMGDGPRVDCILHANSSWDALTLTECRTGPTWQSLLGGGAGELLIRTKVLQTDGLVFHAAAVDDNGRGVVFVGHSGEGKSTQASLWKGVSGACLINEDRIAVRMKPGGPVCYGLPWAGKSSFALNHQVPLSALVLLEHAPTSRIQLLPPSIAAPLLLARAFLPYWDRALMQTALNTLEALLRSVPVLRLCCRPQPEAVSLVRSML